MFKLNNFKVVKEGPLGYRLKAKYLFWWDDVAVAVDPCGGTEEFIIAPSADSVKEDTKWSTKLYQYLEIGYSESEINKVVEVLRANGRSVIFEA